MLIYCRKIKKERARNSFQIPKVSCGASKEVISECPKNAQHETHVQTRSSFWNAEQVKSNQDVVILDATSVDHSEVMTFPTTTFEMTPGKFLDTISLSPSNW